MARIPGYGKSSLTDLLLIPDPCIPCSLIETGRDIRAGHFPGCIILTIRGKPADVTCRLLQTTARNQNRYPSLPRNGVDHAEGTKDGRRGEHRVDDTVLADQ